jgi:hypothetical protein
VRQKRLEPLRNRIAHMISEASGDLSLSPDSRENARQVNTWGFPSSLHCASYGHERNRTHSAAATPLYTASECEAHRRITSCCWRVAAGDTE